MELKNKDLERLIEMENLPELSGRIYYSEEDDMDGLSESAFVLREAEWIVEDFEVDGYMLHDVLTDARRLIRETQDGKVIPIDSNTFRPKEGYRPGDIQNARETIAEYKRTKAFVKKMWKLTEGGERDVKL